MNKETEGNYIPIKAYDFIVPHDAFESDEDKPKIEKTKIPIKQASKAKHQGMVAPGSKTIAQMPKNLLLDKSKPKTDEISNKDLHKNTETEEDTEIDEENLVMFEKQIEKATLSMFPQASQRPKQFSINDLAKPVQRPNTAKIQTKVPDVFKAEKAVNVDERKQKEEIKQKAINVVSD